MPDKKGKPDEFYVFWEPGTQAVQIVGRVIKKWRTNMLVEYVSMLWGDRWIRVSKIQKRIPISSATKLDKPPAVHVEYVRRPYR